MIVHGPDGFVDMLVQVKEQQETIATVAVALVIGYGH